MSRALVNSIQVLGQTDQWRRRLTSGGFQGSCRLKVNITPPYLC